MALVPGDGGGGSGRYVFKRNQAQTGKSPQAVALERAQAAAEAKRQAQAAENARLLNEARRRGEESRIAAINAMKQENARREAIRAAASAEAQARSYANRQAGEKAAAAKAELVPSKGPKKSGKMTPRDFQDDSVMAGRTAQVAAGKKAEQTAKEKAEQRRLSARERNQAKEARAEAKSGEEARLWERVRNPEDSYGKKFKTLEEWEAEEAAKMAGKRPVGMYTTDPETGEVILDPSFLAVQPDYLKYQGKEGTFWKSPFQSPEFNERDVWRYGATRATDPKWLAEWRGKAVRAGLIDDDAFLTDQWGDADYRAMSILVAEVNTSVYTDPMDLLNSQISSGYGNPVLSDSTYSSGGGGGGGGGKGDTLTQQVFSKTGIEDGRAILRQQMRNLLGRAPTDAEVSQYVASLNAVEAVTPQITTVTSSGSTTTTKTVANAPNPDEVLRRSVETGNKAENENYEGSQYYDVIQDLIGGAF
jgi:hypothetical protein